MLGLIAAPAGAAAWLTARPFRGLAISGAIAVGAMWGGLALSYAINSLPPSSAIIALAAAAYAVCAAASRLRRPQRTRSGPPAARLGKGGPPAAARPPAEVDL